MQPYLSSTNIAALLRPEAYPHAVGDLKLLETHISWVVLTGGFAYKIKKPCKFDFVDYSTLELRHTFCLKELDFNRRLAADLYLDVVPIYADAEEGLHFGGDSRTQAVDSPPIEYAVKMKQFPQEAILSARLDHDQLIPHVIDRFGADLARFHEAVESAPTDLECVRLHHIRHDAMDNLLALKQALPRDSELRPLLDSLGTWTEEEFARREAAFQRRLDRGFVCRCHGDMHLNNLVQLDDRVTAFDCIEFNEEFQWIDVMSDLAFPVMDFSAKGRADMGSRLLSGYLEAREDWDGLDVFRFYVVYRALVRAKVTWLDRTKHVLIDTKDHIPRDTGPWEEYIRTAYRFAFPPAGRLAITHGVSGSGKSTKALEYVSRRNAIRVRSDIERLRVADQAPHDRYSIESRARVYDRLSELAGRLLGLQYSVVVDATFLKHRQRQRFAALASSVGVPFDILTCNASVEELEDRIKQRTGDASEATLSVLHRQLAEIEPLTDSEKCAVVPS